MIERKKFLVMSAEQVIDFRSGRPLSDSDEFERGTTRVAVISACARVYDSGMNIVDIAQREYLPVAFQFRLLDGVVVFIPSERYVRVVGALMLFLRPEKIWWAITPELVGSVKALSANKEKKPPQLLISAGSPNMEIEAGYAIENFLREGIASLDHPDRKDHREPEAVTRIIPAITR